MAELHSAEYYSRNDRDYLARLAELAGERLPTRARAERRRVRLALALDLFPESGVVHMAIEVGPTASQIAAQLGCALTADEILAVARAVTSALGDTSEGADFGVLKAGGRS
jgi:hypothetical protein